MYLFTAVLLTQLYNIQTCLPMKHHVLYNKSTTRSVRTKLTVQCTFCECFYYLWWWRHTWPSSWSSPCPCSGHRYQVVSVSARHRMYNVRKNLGITGYKMHWQKHGILIYQQWADIRYKGTDCTLSKNPGARAPVTSRVRVADQKFKSVRWALLKNQGTESVNSSN